MRKKKHIEYTYCPVEAALDIIGGKWKAIILFRILEETRRFGQLQKLLPNITTRMLTKQLRELEKDGLLHRKVYPVVPPKVEYSITDLGKTLLPLLNELKLWSEEHMIKKI